MRSFRGESGHYIGTGSMVRQNNAIKSDVAKAGKNLAHTILQRKAMFFRTVFHGVADNFSSFTVTFLAGFLSEELASRVILSLMHAAAVRNQHTLAIAQHIARVTLAALLTTATTICWRGQPRADNGTSRSAQLIVAVLRTGHTWGQRDSIHLGSNEQNTQVVAS